MTTTTHTFTLPDMSCGGCVQGVTRAVQALDAAATVQAELPQHRVTVTSSQPRDVLAQAIADAGFAEAPGA